MTVLSKSCGPGFNPSMYVDILNESDYIEKLVPYVGILRGKVLDIGAGTGGITRHCLSEGARWIAVEPNEEMQRILKTYGDGDLPQGVCLDIIPSTWENLCPETKADVALAFNIGAAHHEAARLFDCINKSGAKDVVWIVPAQEAPSSYCLSGFIPNEFYGEDECLPAYLRTLDQLGHFCQPDRIDFVAWTCRYTFQSKAELFEYFMARRSFLKTPSKDSDIKDYLGDRLRFADDALQVSCKKRSAVMRWTLA